MDMPDALRIARAKASVINIKTWALSSTSRPPHPAPPGLLARRRSALCNSNAEWAFTVEASPWNPQPLRAHPRPALSLASGRKVLLPCHPAPGFSSQALYPIPRGMYPSHLGLL